MMQSGQPTAFQSVHEFQASLSAFIEQDSSNYISQLNAQTAAWTSKLNEYANSCPYTVQIMSEVMDGHKHFVQKQMKYVRDHLHSLLEFQYDVLAMSPTEQGNTLISQLEDLNEGDSLGTKEAAPIIASFKKEFPDAVLDNDRLKRTFGLGDDEVLVF